MLAAVSTAAETTGLAGLSKATIALVSRRYRSPLIAEVSLFPNSIACPLELSDEVRQVVFRSVASGCGAEHQDEFDWSSRELYGKLQPQAPVDPDFASGLQNPHGSLHLP